MVREIQAIEQRVGMQPISLPRVSGGEQLINSLQGFSNIFKGVVESAATENAAIQGMLDREGDKEVNLRPGVTRPTAAYNQAYRDTDARMLSRGGLDLIANTISEINNPAKLNSTSVQEYDSKIEGIIQGTLSQALPENRVQVRDRLLAAAQSGRSKIQNSVMNYENKQIKQNFQNEYTELKEDRFSARLQNDEERVAQIDEDLAKLFTDWGTLSEEINVTIPSLVQEIAQQDKNAQYLGDFINAQTIGLGDQYIESFAASNTQELREQDKLQLVSQMMKMNNTVKAAEASSQAVAQQTLVNEIDNPLSPNHISTQAQLEQTEEYQRLTPLQQQQISHKLIVKNVQAAKSDIKIAQANIDIANGRAAFVDKSTINQMFLDKLASFEAKTGKAASLATKFSLVQELKTNVPKFDALMADMLTNGATDTAAAAGVLYATAQLQKQDNLIKLSGDAATIAEKMATQYNLTANPSTDVVKGILKQVLEKNQPQVEERLQAATTAFSKNGAKYFKEVMGVEPEPFQDQGAYAVFKEAFMSSMVRGNTAEEATRIAKNAMSEWGDDPWFPKDTISIAPPSKMLPMSAGNYNIRNQIMLQFNEIIKANDASLKKGKDGNGGTKMSFVGDVEIPQNMTQADYVFKPIGGKDVSDLAKSRILPKEGEQFSVTRPTSDIPAIVNGVESNLKLISSPITPSNPDLGLRYGLFAQDKFGVYQQLSDPRSPDGLAYVLLQDVNKVAPKVTEEQDRLRVQEAQYKAERIQRRAELQQILLEQKKQRSIGLFDIANPSVFAPKTTSAIESKFIDIVERGINKLRNRKKDDE